MRVAVVGAGPAGLMAAEVAASAGAAVTVYDRMPSAGRKLLLAGRGGLNLSHSEHEAAFLERYGPAASVLSPAIRSFGPPEMRRWCAGLGVETFVGSSGRVFPRSFKTSPLLRAWLRRLDGQGVQFRFRHRWHGWSGQSLAFEANDGTVTATHEATILALGGASWPHLGSDGRWTAVLGAQNVALVSLQAANCGYRVAWTDLFRERFQGEPVKSVAATVGEHRSRGDLVVTRSGLEGGPLYALAAPIRAAIAGGPVQLRLALRPDLAHETIFARLASRQRKQSLSTALRKTLGLAPVAIGLLRETARLGQLPLADLDAEALARLINDVPIVLQAPMPIERAISTAGGVDLGAIDLTYMLKARPGTFVAGEMLDWEAPTGGYLLQACFATGAAAGHAAVAWIERERIAALNGSGEPSRP